jgi:NADH-quinone oxidoreductase subunit J
MARVDIAGVAFVALALLTLGSAAIVAFARSVMHSAAGLLGVLCGVAGFYALLSADFLAAVQLLVYVGGTLVVFLFAVMLTLTSARAASSNEPIATGRRAAGWATIALAFALVTIALDTIWPLGEKLVQLPTTAKLGHALLGPYALPFELLALLLLATTVGALAIARSAVKVGAEP